jgi:hypothetical protein
MVMLHDSPSPEQGHKENLKLCTTCKFAQVVEFLQGICRVLGSLQTFELLQCGARLVHKSNTQPPARWQAAG